MVYKRTNVVLGVVALQLIFAALLIFEFFFVIFSDESKLDWRLVELFEIGEFLLAIFSFTVALILIRYLLGRNRLMSDQLKLASGAFHDLMLQRFEEWSLTDAEKDVAAFTIKGMTISEIARLRETSEGTIKAQNNAVYRKAGVSSRTQLLSIFIDELMHYQDWP